MTIGENITRIRLEKGLSRTQVAEACGTVGPTIRAYEIGKANPKPATVAKIAKALGVSPAELYGMVENPQLSAAYDQDTVAAIYQSLLIESGGVIDEDSIDTRHLLAAFRKLNKQGRKEAVNRLEEMASIPKFQENPNILDTLTEEERNEILYAYHSLKNLLYEKSLMEAKNCKSKDALRSNRLMIAEKQEIIASTIMAALERAGIE